VTVPVEPTTPTPDANAGGFCLALAVGPVQDFIGAARRLSDLEAGSGWLQLLVHRAACDLLDLHGATLLSPAADPAGRPPATGLTNVILAALPPDARPLEVVEAVRGRLTNFARRHATAVALSLHGSIDAEAMASQVVDALRLEAAWVTFEGDLSVDAVRRAERLLAARKHSRPFGPSAERRTGIAKSSLDGLRESVILTRSPVLVGRLRLGQREHLDGLGVLRRRWGRRSRLPALTRVALEPWVRAVVNRVPGDVALGERWRAVLDAYEELVHLGEATRCRGVEDLAFDGELLFAKRAQQAAAITAEGPRPSGALNKFATNVQALRTELRRCGLPEMPVPYVAMLQADGDLLGPFMSKLSTLEDRARVGQALRNFSDGLAATVARFGAHVLYAGGEDALIVAPFDRALEVARSVREAFVNSFQGFAGAPTISVGVAIRHVLQPARSLRNAAAAALTMAKNASASAGPQRNALAIDLCPRAGSPVRARGAWDGLPSAPGDDGGGTPPDGFDGHLIRLARGIASGELPSDLPYRWRSMSEDAFGSKDVFGLKLGRTLARQSVSRGWTQWFSQVCEPRYGQQTPMDRADEVLNQLLVARWLAQHRSGA
jgi:CRISPR-associated protein Cmr2